MFLFQFYLIISMYGLRKKTEYNSEYLNENELEQLVDWQ